MLQIILIVLIGSLVSGFGTLIGFGGGVFMVPILVIGFGFPITSAIGAVSVALLPMGIISTIYNHKSGTVDYGLGVLLEIPTVAGAILGALITAWLPVEKLEIIFTVFISLIGLQMMLGDKENDSKFTRFLNRLNKIPPSFTKVKNNKTYTFSGIVTTLMGLMAGSFAGLFGVGGGFLKGPIMIKVFKIPARIAASTALFMIIFTSLSASITHYMLGHIHWNLALPVIISFFIGSFTGNRFTGKFSDTQLNNYIGIALMLAALTMLYNLLFA